ncbi:MAG: superoxide dismutase [Bacteroidales bacterium]|jgi:Fe-Mn family superoxide dismutase|nr:superoxide dismutase [Bacteroidales bacterium]
MKKLIILLLVINNIAIIAQTTHKLPSLPYSNDALEPVMSKETIEYHHGKHVKTYVDNLNKLIPGTKFEHSSLEEITKNADGAIFNNGAQILNHSIFFDSFAPENEAKHKPTGKLSKAIERDFGSFDNFKKEFATSATGVFGSGWTWLTMDEDGKLKIISLPNAGNPLRDGYKPLLGFDVWEHSYYIDYRNKRAEYIENLWKIVDWKVIEKRFEK